MTVTTAWHLQPGCSFCTTLYITLSPELRAASASHKFSSHSPRASDKEMTDEKKICFFLD